MGSEPRRGDGNQIDRFTDACVTSAARRWPSDIGDGMAAEWRAELAVLRAERGMSRSLAAIRYAVSLALSPAVDREADWRSRTSGLGRAALGALSAVGVAVLATLLYNVTTFPLLGFVPFVGPAPEIVDNVFTVVLLALFAAGMAWLGSTLARRSWSTPASALQLIPALGLALFATQFASTSMAFSQLPRFDLGVFVLAWIALTSSATGMALRSLRMGRRRRGWLFATAGNLAALDLAGIAGGLRFAGQRQSGYARCLLWLPLSLTNAFGVNFGRLYPGSGTPTIDGVSHSGSPIWSSEILLGAVGAVAGPLLLCSALVVAYAMHPRRTSVPMSERVVDASPAADRMRLVSAIGTGGVTVGLVIWAFSAGIGIGTHAVWLSDIDLSTLRITAIALVVTAIPVMLAGRAPVALPALWIFGILVAADCLVAGPLHHRLHGVRATAVLLFVGAAAVVIARMRSSPAEGDDGAGRRARMSAAVAAPTVVPTTLPLHHHPIPAAVVVVSCVLAAALWLVAITAAKTNRRTPMTRLGTAVYVVVPITLLVLFVSGIAERAFGIYQDELAAFFIQLPLVVVAVAAAHGSSVTGRVRRLGAWLLLGAGAAVVALPLASVLATDDIFGAVIVRVQPGWDGASGQLMLAATLGAIAAIRFRPSPERVFSSTGSEG